MFVIDASNKQPIYEQIKTQVIDFIALGILGPNEQLPPVRNLANDLGVNPNTVSKAYQLLEQLGYIYSQIGRGSFVSDPEQTTQLLILEKRAQLIALIKYLNTIQFPQNDIVEIVTKIYEGGDVT